MRERKAFFFVRAELGRSSDLILYTIVDLATSRHHQPRRKLNTAERVLHLRDENTMQGSRIVLLLAASDRSAL
jgi:hypothetical protein